MKAVYKYILDPDNIVTANLPRDSVPLHFAIQKGQLCLWALVDQAASGFEAHRFRMAGTGHPIDDDVTGGSHFQTMLVADGDLVFHFFRLPPV